MHALMMCFNNMLTDGETQARATYVTTAATIGSVKTLKNAWKMFFSDAHAIITYLYQHMLLISLINTGDNITALLAILSSVFNKINQYLPYLFFVCKHIDRWCFTTFFNTEFCVMF